MWRFISLNYDPHLCGMILLFTHCDPFFRAICGSFGATMQSPAMIMSAITGNFATVADSLASGCILRSIIYQKAHFACIFKLYMYNRGTMEFAVIQTGGKQYKVTVGDVIKIEKIAGDHKEGDAVTFDKVLLVDNGKDTTIGTPFIGNATVKATITEIGRAAKISVIKYKQKSKYFKKRGHRQPYFKVKIDSFK
jgi:large subunit ribosomal protein L21